MKMTLCRFEWKLADLWVGCFWKTTRTDPITWTDIWICVVPCIPLHIQIMWPVTILFDEEKAVANHGGEEMSREIIAKEYAADLSQPFTVEWLCEIGGWRHGGYFVTFTASGGERFNYSLNYERWTLQGTIVPNQPKTRGEVLKWLDVLGIVPATTKGGDK